MLVRESVEERGLTVVEDSLVVGLHHAKAVCAERTKASRQIATVMPIRDVRGTSIGHGTIDPAITGESNIATMKGKELRNTEEDPSMAGGRDRMITDERPLST
jgi:hypothetical protein